LGELAGVKYSFPGIPIGVLDRHDSLRAFIDARGVVVVVK